MRNHSVNTPWNEEIISKRCACKSRCFKYRFKSAGTYRTKNGGQGRQGQNAGMGSAGRGGFRRQNGGTLSVTDKATTFLETSFTTLRIGLRRETRQAHVRREVFQAKEVGRQCPGCRRLDATRPSRQHRGAWSPQVQRTDRLRCDSERSGHTCQVAVDRRNGS